MATPDYWIFDTAIATRRNRPVQAKLIEPPRDRLMDMYGSYGYRAEMQNAPYGVALDLTFEVDPAWPHPDNYFQSAGFSLYSDRLVELMLKFGVRAEHFPVKMVGKQGQPLPELQYQIFHVLEGVIDAMDPDRSEWRGSRRAGMARLALKEGGFERRPVFNCDHVFLQLMRDDLRQEIKRLGITGFAFLAPERYTSGKFGWAPAFED